MNSDLTSLSDSHGFTTNVYVTHIHSHSWYSRSTSSRSGRVRSTVERESQLILITVLLTFMLGGGDRRGVTCLHLPGWSLDFNVILLIQSLLSPATYWGPHTQKINNRPRLLLTNRHHPRHRSLWNSGSVTEAWVLWPQKHVSGVRKINWMLAKIGPNTSMVIYGWSWGREEEDKRRWGLGRFWGSPWQTGGWGTFLVLRNPQSHNSAASTSLLLEKGR